MMLDLTHFCRMQRPLALAVATLAGSCLSTVSAAAQTPANAAGLPDAPSVVAMAQYTQRSAPGSGFKYTPASTTTGPLGTVIEHASDEPKSLSLDDAISLAFERNLRLRYDNANRKIVRGERLDVLQAIFPNVSVGGDVSAKQIDLAAMGFKPSSLKGIPGFSNVSIPQIVKVNIDQAQISLNQTLFNLEDLEIYRGAKEEFAVVEIDRDNNREAAVDAVAVAYLRVLADNATIDNARALERSSKQAFDNASQQQQAGTGTSLDTLRGQVDYQMRQQERIADEGQQRKDVILLNRIMGVPAEARWQFTDTVPFVALGDMDLARALDAAYKNRKDLQALDANLHVAHYAARAAKYERLPVVGINGYYGVLGQIGGVQHGVFSAMGSLRFPIFREAAIRGDEEIAGAQVTALGQQRTSLRGDIDAQLRASLLDVAADAEQVRLAQSSLELAEQELRDENDRFAAGVDDNLPLVRGEAAVAGAQAQVVNALFQFNVAKLGLARNTGLLETNYRAYLGR